MTEFIRDKVALLDRVEKRILRDVRGASAYAAALAELRDRRTAFASQRTLEQSLLDSTVMALCRLHDPAATGEANRGCFARAFRLLSDKDVLRFCLERSETWNSDSAVFAEHHRQTALLALLSCRVRYRRSHRSGSRLKAFLRPLRDYRNQELAHPSLHDDERQKHQAIEHTVSDISSLCSIAKELHSWSHQQAETLHIGLTGEMIEPKF